jgi:uncharacterized protein YerC
MHVSAKKLRSSDQQQLLDQLTRVLAEISTPEEMKQFLGDFLTKTELNVLSKRLAILTLLAQNTSYTEIQKRLKVSSATISSVAEMRPTQGGKLAIQTMQSTQWAEEMTQKIWDRLPEFLKK